MKIIVDNSNLRIEEYELGSWATNAYLVICPRTSSSILIDAPPGAYTLAKHLKETNFRRILLTHSHIDHYAGLQALRKRMEVPYAVHPADNQKWLPFPPDSLLEDGEIIQVGKVSIKAIHTPGHTPGSMCFIIGDYVIAGDTVFPGGPGRTLTPSDFRQIVKSITEKIFILPDSTKIYPGHGKPTILQKEKDEFAVFSSRTHDVLLCKDVVWLSS